MFVGFFLDTNLVWPLVSHFGHNSGCITTVSKISAIFRWMLVSRLHQKVWRCQDFLIWQFGGSFFNFVSCYSVVDTFIDAKIFFIWLVSVCRLAKSFLGFKQVSRFARSFLSWRIANFNSISMKFVKESWWFVGEVKILLVLKLSSFVSRKLIV